MIKLGTITCASKLAVHVPLATGIGMINRPSFIFETMYILHITPSRVRDYIICILLLIFVLAACNGDTAEIHSQMSDKRNVSHCKI